MALTLNNFWGAEGTESEYLSTSAGVGFGTTIPSAGGGTYSYQLVGADHLDLNPFASVSDAGTKCILGFSFRTSSTLGSSEQIARLWDGTNTDFDIYWDGSSDRIQLRTSAGTAVISSGSSSISANTWYRIEVYVDRVNSGAAELFIDGTSIGTTSAQDFSAITGTDELRFDGFDSGTQYIDHIYFGTGATSAADRLGNNNGEVGVVAYWSSLASATPDTGTALDTGTWAAVQLVDRTAAFGTTILASYTASAVSGSVNTDDAGGSAGTGGPNTDTDVDNDPIGTKGIWQLSRSGGGGTTHYGLLGNNTDGTTQFTFTLNQGTGETFEAVSESATIVPTASEYCKIGFETSGAQDIECYGMVAQVLHVPKYVQSITSGFDTLTLTDYDTTINDKTEVESGFVTLTTTAYLSTAEVRNDIESDFDTLTLTKYDSDASIDVNVQSTFDTLTSTAYLSTAEVRNDIESDFVTLTTAVYTSAINNRRELVSGFDTLTFAEYTSQVNDKLAVISDFDTLTLVDYDSTVEVRNDIVSTLGTLTLVPYATSLNVKKEVTSGFDTLTLTPYNSTAELFVPPLFEITGQLNFGGGWSIIET